ncbi:SDR family oxidoreductase [Paenalkalicoccus suaedae]|uniref:SDR family oxidoreductase n=1 Tax=Paenalkalicoccus suaedae TaxID=2592382 RepID=A0A859FDR8_9BACI|nr:SDR family oxidoreductase [Paenalkalicoccus suaedae]QKS70395.1 SDR family oxidoreductase [Paenalkalicoccus suaedae]
MKIAIVTGANSGLGFATSVGLLKQGIHVIFACRSEKNGHEAVERAQLLTGSDQATFIPCDLSSLSSIDRFCELVMDSFDHIDILVNNAAILPTKRTETKNGFEMQLGVNHLGHFYLTTKLLSLIEKSEDGRIVVISSDASKWGSIDYEDPHFTKRRYRLFKAYGQSKLANLLFTVELAKRSHVSVNAVHPGAVATQLGVNRQTGFGKTIHRVLRPFFQTPTAAAETVLYLATDDDAIGLSGGYYYKKQERPFKPPVDPSEFWNWSEEQLRTAKHI